MAKDWYRLGGKATCFTDPEQSDDDAKFINATQAKQLELTPRVEAAKKGEGLIKITEAEAKELNDETAAKNAAFEAAELAKKKRPAAVVIDTTAIAASTEANAKADAKLEEAAKTLEEAKVLKKEAENKTADFDDLQAKHDEAILENDALRKQLAEKGKGK